MLNCVYHPTQEMRVVTDEERDRLLASGDWFDHPNKAIEARKNSEKPIEKPKKGRKSNEKSCHG